VQLSRFAADARLEIDNNVAENALRGIALGRKNISSPALISAVSEWLNGVNPEAYLRYTLTKIAEEHPISRVEELMPWA
jgi:transposase